MAASNFSNLLYISRNWNSTSLYRAKSPLIELVTFFLKSWASLWEPNISNCTIFVDILTSYFGFEVNNGQQCNRIKRIYTNDFLDVAYKKHKVEKINPRTDSGAYTLEPVRAGLEEHCSWMNSANYTYRLHLGNIK